MAKAPELTDAAGKQLLYGMNLDQVDALDRLVNVITAMGDVFVMGSADLRKESLSALGDVVFDGAFEIRGILDTIYTQKLTTPK